MSGYGEHTPIVQDTIGGCIPLSRKKPLTLLTSGRPQSAPRRRAGQPETTISYADGQKGRRVCTPTALRNPKWSVSTLEIGPGWPPGAPSALTSAAKRMAGARKYTLGDLFDHTLGKLRAAIRQTGAEAHQECRRRRARAGAPDNWHFPKQQVAPMQPAQRTSAQNAAVLAMHTLPKLPHHSPFLSTPSLSRHCG